MVTATRTKRNEPDATESAATASPPSASKKAKFDVKLSQHYPSITATTIRTLKWGHARDLLLPYLSHEDRANIHKKSRTVLATMLEERIEAGDVTPEQFWAVAGKEKPKPKPLDPVIAKAMKKNKAGATTHKSPVAAAPSPSLPKKASPAQRAPAPSPPKKASPAQRAPAPSVPRMFLPRPMPMGMPMAVGSPPGVPYMPVPPRPLYKYTLRIPASIWPSTKYPPGIVIGEPCPPSPIAPPSVTGTFYGSAILAIGPGDKLLHPNDAKEQIKYIYRKLELVMTQLNASCSDVVSITAHVVDIHVNGKIVMNAHSEFTTGNGKRCIICAWTMIGVSGLMPKGCLVQLEVRAIARRAMLANLILDVPAVPAGGKKG